MHHCVFSASADHPSCQEAINRAKRVMAFLDEDWAIEHDCVLCSYHSKFSTQEEFGNYSIWLDNDSQLQLISDCMAFARTMERFRWLDKQNNV
jgi:hypothetical protein